jgi:hypothetical protein
MAKKQAEAADQAADTGRDAVTEPVAEAPEIIELVAVERGFAMGRLVEPGAKFKFRAKDANGKDRKIPKWAQLADKPMPQKVTVKNGDLKPADAQAAVKVKAGQLAGN